MTSGSTAHCSQPRSIVMMGVAGSGKSVVGEALATALKLRFIEGDRLHSQDNIARMSAGQPLEDAHRWGWLDAIGAQIADAERVGAGAIAACSALKRAYRDRLRGFSPCLLFIHLEVDPDTARHRVAGRKRHFMSPRLVDSQFATLERPTEDERAVFLDGRQPVPDLVKAASVLITGHAT